MLNVYIGNIHSIEKRHLCVSVVVCFTQNMLGEKDKTKDSKEKDNQIVRSAPLTGLSQEDVDTLEKFISEIMALKDQDTCQQFFDEHVPIFGKNKDHKARLYLCMRQPAFLRFIDMKHITVDFLCAVLNEYRHASWNDSFLMAVPIDLVKNDQRLMIRMITMMQGCDVFLEDRHFKQKNIIRALCRYYGGSLYWLGKSTDFVRSDVKEMKEIMEDELARWQSFDPFLHDAVVDSKDVKYKDEIVDWWKVELEKKFPKDYRNGKYVNSKQLTEKISIDIPKSYKQATQESNVSDTGRKKLEVLQEIEDGVAAKFRAKKTVVKKEVNESGKEIDVVHIPNYHDDIVRALQIEYDQQMQRLRNEIKTFGGPGDQSNKKKIEITTESK